ncbi:hypothetical protein LLEC1_00700 [Akanthomyces lecanii]|uniref:Aminoglycoside phosphotransferase domain-containing protein n=1 Tax=Cordyceps confragosa TaxID=2714763 RepID=A0A179IJ39_CORDF|nr:hypothetical protein LLEC1_00700 [Akanthomyces lecanii]
MEATPVRESVREIDENSWLIGGKLVLARAQPRESTWRYNITNAPATLPESRPLSGLGDVKLIHDVGGVSAVFAIGDVAFCKVRSIDIPSATREHTTLAWLHERNWSFAIPNTLHHAEFDNRYYIVLDRVLGSTLDSIWATLEEAQRQRLVKRIVGICAELAVPAPQSNISGVDGCWVPERYLCGRDMDCSPKNLKKSCSELGMDCSTLVFYHCDLGPSNILVDLENYSIGVIDWEIAGFVPIEWMRTKFRVSSGLEPFKW